VLCVWETLQAINQSKHNFGKPRMDLAPKELILIIVFWRFALLQCLSSKSCSQSSLVASLAFSHLWALVIRLMMWTGYFTDQVANRKNDQLSCLYFCKKKKRRRKKNWLCCLYFLRYKIIVCKSKICQKFNNLFYLF